MQKTQKLSPTLPLVNKRDLAAVLARDHSLNLKDAQKMIEAVLSSVMASLTQGRRVYLVGFGTFSVVERRARPARNPMTGEIVHIPARKALKFRPGGKLKRVVSKA